MNTCPKCKMSVQEGLKFCGGCGTEITVGVMGSVAKGAKAHASKAADHAKRTASAELQNGISQVISRTIREIMAKIFGR